MSMEELTMIEDSGLVAVAIHEKYGWITALPIVARDRKQRYWVVVDHTEEYKARVGQVKPRLMMPIWQDGHRGYKVFVSTREAVNAFAKAHRWGRNDGWRPGFQSESLINPEWVAGQIGIPTP